MHKMCIRDRVRITLGDTTLEGTLDELLESGTFKMEYDHAGLNKIVATCQMQDLPLLR